jgi:hypothetical protein
MSFDDDVSFYARQARIECAKEIEKIRAALVEAIRLGNILSEVGRKPNSGGQMAYKIQRNPKVAAAIELLRSPISTSLNPAVQLADVERVRNEARMAQIYVRWRPVDRALRACSRAGAENLDTPRRSILYEIGLTKSR